MNKPAVSDSVSASVSILGARASHRKITPTSIFAFLSLHITFSHSIYAQLELERLFPPTVQHGVATTVNAVGKFPQWPVKIECDFSELSVVCGEKAGEFKVTATETAVGVAWIRVHDSQSASSLIPIAIEPVPTVLEAEPNETLRAAQRVACPVTVVGKLEKSGDVDVVGIALHTGEQLVASVTANTLFGSPMDAVLQLVDARGLVVAQAEDDVGLDPQLHFESTKDGDFYLRLFCFPETPNGTIGFAGGANFVYALRITTNAFVDHVFPLRSLSVEKLKPIAFGWNLPGDLALELKPATQVAPATIHAASALGWQWLPEVPAEGWTFGSDEQTAAPEAAHDLPLLYWGHILQAKQVDRLRVRVREGITYRAEINSREFGFKLDSVLRVLKADLQTQITRNDDAGKKNFDAAVEFKAEKDEELIIEISDLADSGGLRHAYELQIAALEPKVNLNVAADHFRVSIGKSLEIPIAIERAADYVQRLEISASGLPTGVAVEKIYSEPKGDSSKAVKLKLNAASDAMAFQGPIELLFTPVDDKHLPVGNSLPIRHALRPQVSLRHVWLSVAAD